MVKYKITIEYDGTKYKGWQRLKDSDKTIQSKIEALLSRILDQNVEIHGAGRTDAGVHANNQVAHFEIKNEIDTKKLLEVMNEMLPQDIVFKAIEEVDTEFHARFSVKSKHYVYKIVNSSIRPAIGIKYRYYVDKPLDIGLMEEAAGILIGEHDFRSFTANKSKKKSMIRNLYKIDIIKHGDEIDLHLHGEGFLYKMVRIIAGTLIEVGLGQKKPDEIRMILDKRDRKFAGETAPGHGLYLADIEY